ncbi:MAG: DAK2 domain-containing protein [Mycoplasma sp.]|nr:DAK2 domain-containing protein [Mycoplasma sp.]
MINGKDLKNLFISGVNQIINDKDRINAMNVFPVPDGDTGSNMASAVAEAKEEILKLPDNATVSDIADKFSYGMLLGARGNSGVILSQIFKGFSLSLKGKKTVRNMDIVSAVSSASVQAYKSVIEPIEGTILTVIRETAENLEKTVTMAMPKNKVFDLIIKYAEESLNNTPNLLPILKEVGVVDSGGEGLLQFFKGMQSALLGNPVEIKNTSENNHANDFIKNNEIYNGEFGYCSEFIMELNKPKSFNKDKFIEELKKQGSSIVVVVDEKILKVHIHTIKPGKLLSFSQKYGEFIRTKIDNMSLQAGDVQNQNKNNEETENKNTQTIENKKGSTTLISIATGQGIIDEMKNMGADFIIEGGQSTNPSAKDIIKAIESSPTKDVIILPNNSNIVLTAQQAARTIKKKHVVVIPTKTLMEGLTAIMNFNEEEDIKTNKEEIQDAIKTVQTGKVTTAGKTTKIKGVKIKDGEFIGILGKNIIVSTNSKVNAAMKILEKAVTEDSEIVSIFYGGSATSADADELASRIENNFDVETEIKNGGQDLYHFLLAIE